MLEDSDLPTTPCPPPGNTPTNSKGWQPPSTAELQTLLPQYEITALLGRGGMGAVYKGTQKNLDRAVAIKILPPGMDDDDSGANFAERFKNEARAMAKLNHPGIVGVFDSGETADGLLYIVMEFIEGTDVQKMVAEQGRLHSGHAMAITAHVCDALQYAHERGIIHRDIKPANVMVGYDGVVKVADFGLAKIDQSGTSGLTRSGMAMGTLHYMAPEALMLGSSVDHRADIYAVGVMFYFMLTGKLPQGMFELPSLQIPGLDPRFDGIIAKALRDDRDIRYQSAADLRRDLDGILTQPVVKVEANSEYVPAALPAAARPKVHGTFAPPDRVEVRVENRASPILWTAIIVLGGFAVWSMWLRPNPPVSKPPPVATTQTEPEVAPSPLTPSVTAPPSPSNGLPGTSASSPQTIMPPDKSISVATAPSADRQSKPAASPPSVIAKALNYLRSAGWRPMITDIASFGKHPGVTLLPDGWLRLEQTAIPLGRGRNIIVRSKIKKSTGVTQAYTPLRWSIEANRDQSYLRAVIVRGISLTIAYANTDAKQPGWSNRLLLDRPLPQPQDDSEHELALAAIGTTISAYWDGQLVSFVEDNSCPGDQFGLHAISPAILKDPEWLLLDEAGNVILAESDEEKTLRQQFEAAITKQVTPQVAAYALSLQGSYAAALERAIEAPNASPAVVAALKEEVRRLASNKSVPDQDEPETPSALTSLRDTYRKGLETFREQKTAPLKAIYEQQLKALEKSGSMASSNQATKPTAVSNTPFTNSLGMKFIPVPITGGPTNGKRVLFSVWETRVQDYEVFVKETKRMWRKPPFEQGPTHPAVNLNWEDAVAFCTWLTGHERAAGRLGLQEAYRLPSDHEWSCAAGIGGRENAASPPHQKSQNLTDAFLWGSEWPPPPGAGNFHGEEMVGSLFFQTQGILNGYSDGFVRTAPTGTFPPNSLGIFDLSGNVSEFCEDWYDPTQKSRVTRGASWGKDLRNDLLLSCRDKHPPSFQNIILGFRCVIAPVASGTVASSSLSPQVSSSSVATATKGSPFTNSLGMKFVTVPGTKVLFCIHETRRKDFETFCNETGYSTAYWSSQPNGLLAGHEADHPVVGVSWNDAQSFCSWLTKKTGITQRLPTDHEWSCAVGIGDEEAKTPDATPEQLNLQIQNEYPWGRSFPPPDHSGNLADRECGKMFSNQTVLFSYNDGFATTAPVMSFKPNAFGIYDLEGNVSEWCSDLHNDKVQFRVFRGGHWLASAPHYLMSSARMRNTVIAHTPSLGFRVVMEPAP